MSSNNLIAAYFAICFPNFTYYVTTLSCTIGRRSTPNSSGLDAVPVHVDIDLGPMKSVSRLHARIEYDEDSECFVICILGRNGAWVDGVWAKSGSRVPLSSRTTIQIASRTFQFLLATPPQQSDSQAGHSPSPSLVDVIDSDHVADSPLITTLPESSIAAVSPPDVPLSTLCCQAIDACGGKATLGQIRRWLSHEHEWYKVNEGWQASIRNLLSTNPSFFKVRRDKGQKGKDSFYGYRTSVTSKGGKRVSAALDADDDTAAVIDVEGDVIDVDGVDDPPPLHTTPAKRPAASKSLTSTSRPAKKAKTAKKVPRKSLLTEAAVISPAPTPPIPQPATTTTPLATSAEERRLQRRRAELDSKIQAALQARSASTSAQETAGRAVCIPIRIDTAPSGPTIPSTSSSAPIVHQPLSLKQGEIVLSPKVFSHILQTQLEQLRKLETPTVLEILRAELKRSLMEEFRANKAKTRPAGTNGSGPLPGAGVGIGKGPS